MNTGSTAAIIRLYRGDSDKIKEFKMSKVSEYSLLGKGIYLTDKMKLAESYREKGFINNLNTLNLAAGSFKTKGDALKVAFEKYLKYNWENSYGRAFSKANPKLLSKFRNDMLWKFEEDIRKGVVAIKDSRDPNSHCYGGTIRLLLSTKVIGRLSVFEFDNTDNQFDNIVLNVSRDIVDKNVIGAMARFSYFNPLKIEVGEYIENYRKICRAQEITINPTENRYDLLSRNGLRNFDLKYTPTSKQKQIIDKTQYSYGGYGKAMKKFSAILMSMGFKGYEYDGGIICGGYGRHRAFSMWDQEYVNEHLIERRV